MVHHFKKRLDTMEKNTETLGDICKTIVSEIEGIKRNPEMRLPSETSSNNSFPATMNSNQQDELIRMLNGAPSSYMSMFIGGTRDENPIFSGMNIDHTQEGDLDNVEIISDSSSESGSDSQDDSVEEMQLHEIDDENDESDTNHIVLKEDHQSDTIFVTKLDETEPLEVVDTESLMTSNENEEMSVLEDNAIVTRKSLQKMTVQMLRTIVIRDGYCTDPSKLKKLEIINLIMDQNERNL